MGQGVTPKDLGGEVWANKTVKLWNGLSLEGEATMMQDLVACWDCGLAGKVAGLGSFKCSKCAPCSGLALKSWTRPDEVLPVHGAEMISRALADFDPGVQLHTTLHFVGYISALHAIKRKIKESTRVSVPLMTDTSTLIVLDVADHSAESIAVSGQQEPHKAWVLSGTRCRLCGKCKIAQAVVLSEGFGDTWLCVHVEGNDVLVSRELGKRSVLECGTTRLLGGVQVRLTRHPDIAVMLPKRVGSEELVQWASGFAPHEPTRPSVSGGATYIRTLVLPVGGGGDRTGKKQEAVGDWVIGLDLAVVALHELWEMKLDEQGWTEGCKIFEGEKGWGMGLAVMVQTWVMASQEEGVVVMDNPDALLISFHSVTGEAWVVGSIHLRPEGYGPKLAALKDITATLQVIGPDSVLIGGDFNSQPHLGALALATHIRSSVGWERLGLKPGGDQSQPMCSPARERCTRRPSTIVMCRGPSLWT